MKLILFALGFGLSLTGLYYGIQGLLWLANPTPKMPRLTKREILEREARSASWRPR